MSRRCLSVFLIIVLTLLVISGYPSPAAAATADGKVYPIVFVPGIGGSYLMAADPPPWCIGCTDWTIWLSVGQVLTGQLPWSDLYRLRYDEDGVPVDSGIWLGDIIRAEGSNDAYGKYMGFLATKGYSEETDSLGNSNGWLSAFPYDFRNSIEKNASLLAQHIDRVLKHTGAEKVILTAHSTGGLISRTYLVNTAGAKVAGLITMGTPWLGSPMMTKALSAGWDFGLPILYDPDITRQLVVNWPGAHALAPGPRYQEVYPGGFLNFKKWPWNSQNALLEVDSLADQLTAQRGFNPALYDGVQLLRGKIFNGQDYGVPMHVIAGDLGSQSTMIKYKYAVSEQFCTGNTIPDCKIDIPPLIWWLGDAEDEDMGNGDNTVPLRSALLGCPDNASEGTVCTNKYIGTIIPHVLKADDAKHGDLPKLSAVENLVWSAIDEIEGKPNISVPVFTLHAGEDLTVTATLGTGGENHHPLTGKTVRASLDVLDPNIGIIGDRLPLESITDGNGQVTFNFYHVGYIATLQGIHDSAGYNIRLKIEFSGDEENVPAVLQREQVLLPCRYGTLRGNVLEKDSGKPIPYAHISVNSPDGSWIIMVSTANNANGSFSVSTIVGSSYQVVVSGTPYLPRTIAPVQVLPGLVTDLGTIILAPVPASVGNGFIGSGPPSGGTMVSIWGQGFTWATGVYFGTIPASSFTIRSDNEIQAVTPPGAGTVTVTVASPYGTSTVNPWATFSYTGVLGGQVKDSAGKPVAGATVRLWLPTNMTTQFQTLTDSTGAYLFPDVPPGSYVVVVAMTGYAPFLSSVVDAVSAQTVTRDLSLTPLYNLTILKNGDGTGRVVSYPAAISCGEICTGVSAENTQITLSETVDAGYFFGGWEGCDRTNGSQCIVALTGNRSVTAIFTTTPPQYLVTAAKGDKGSGLIVSEPAGIDCGAVCSSGFNFLTSATLIATPDAGSIFGGWLGCPSANANRCTVTDTSTVTAHFQPIPPPDRVTVLKSGNGSGIVVSNPPGINCGNSCSNKFDLTKALVLTAAPGATSTFAGWTGCDSTADNQCTLEKSGAALDSSFNPSLAGPVKLIAPLGAGRFFLAGDDLLSIDGQTRSIALVNADGSVNSAFNPYQIGTSNNSNESRTVNAAVSLSNGNVLVAVTSALMQWGGDYRSYYLTKLTADGTVDDMFTPAFTSPIGMLAVQPDGKILAGGDSQLMRISDNGEVEYSFNPRLAGNTYGNYYIDALSVQPDGKILVGRHCDGGNDCGFLTRLNDDGSPDSSFVLWLNSTVHAIICQPDAKILIGGDFTNAGGGLGRNYLVRVNEDGSLDDIFHANFNGAIHSLALQADGKILVGGQFLNVDGLKQSYLARLNVDGAWDASFSPVLDGAVEKISMLSDNAVLVGGAFTAIDGQAHRHVARILIGDLASNRNVAAAFTAGPLHFIKGDINDDGAATLADAITALVIAGGRAPEAIRADYFSADIGVTSNGIGLSEAIYILQVLAEIR